MITILEEEMKKAGISFYTLTGAVKKDQRAKMVEAFNKDDTTVFFISLKAGGTGLNLTAADIVIHYDPWWNLAVQNQATDRAHRIGQENVVMVYKLIAKGTIEDNIVQLQEKKSQLANSLLEGDGMGSAGFTREELEELLKL
jgi:SNF2 family DNA or RNA helicase